MLLALLVMLAHEAQAQQTSILSVSVPAPDSLGTAFPAGEIIFGNADSTTSGQSDSLFVFDITNTRIGIGTNDPQRTIHGVGPNGQLNNFPSGLGAQDAMIFENNSNANIGLLGLTSASIKTYKDSSSTYNAIIYNVFADSSWRISATPGNINGGIEVHTDGTLSLNQYTGGAKDGTFAGVLGVDASGNMVTTNPSSLEGDSLGMVFVDGRILLGDGTRGGKNDAFFVFDDANNRLGVGIATPLGTIHSSLTSGSNWVINESGASWLSTFSNSTTEAAIAYPVSGSGSGLRFGTTTSSSGGSFTEQMTITGTTGQLQLNNYTSSNSFSGTAAGNLAFDASGNIITEENTYQIGLASTSGNETVDIDTIVTTDGTAYFIECTTVAVQTNGGTSESGLWGVIEAGYQDLTCCAPNLSYSLRNDFENNGYTGTAVALVISGGNIVVRVTGSTGQNFDWKTSIRIVKIST